MLPGRYSQRSTALPRSDRVVNVRSGTGNDGTGPCAIRVDDIEVAVPSDRADVVAVGQELVVRGRLKFLGRAVVAVRDERLRVDLERQIRRKRVVQPRDQAELRLVERREDIRVPKVDTIAASLTAVTYCASCRIVQYSRPERDVPAWRRADRDGRARRPAVAVRPIGHHRELEAAGDDLARIGASAAL